MVTREELERLAALAKLSLTQEDTEQFAENISEMLDFANAVAGAETDAPDEASMEPWALRADEVCSSLPVDEVLKNAGETRDGYFVARRMGGPLDEQHK